jgi:hypothetical protein
MNIGRGLTIGRALSERADKLLRRSTFLERDFLRSGHFKLSHIEANEKIKSVEGMLRGRFARKTPAESTRPQRERSDEASQSRQRN